MESVSFPSGHDQCAGWFVRATSDALQTSAGCPCVVMAHGFAATKDTGLLPFAERFAAAGLDVLLFDYRGFGDSGGALRQDVNHLRHRKDYHAAITWARSQAGVDPSRIVLWGSSYSGGHVVAVAAQDPQVAALISQGAAMDGLAALMLVGKTSGWSKVAALTVDGLRDAARAITRRGPYLVPVVGEPGSSAVISTPGSLEGYSAITGPSFRNEICGRGILRLALNRPVLAASKVTCPTLYIVAERDVVAPPAAVRAAAVRTGVRAEVETYDCGHFAIYVDEVFEKSVTRQVEFLLRHLTPQR